MRVLLADDQFHVRSALRFLLKQELSFQVIGEAADATGLLRAVGEYRPDLILLDWELPGLPIIQLVRLLRYEQPSLIIIAMSSQSQAKKQALDAKVQHFFQKSEPPDQVLAIIRESL